VLATWLGGRSVCALGAVIFGHKKGPKLGGVLAVVWSISFPLERMGEEGQQKGVRVQSGRSLAQAKGGVEQKFPTR